MALDDCSNSSTENARNIPSADSPRRKAPSTPKRTPLALLPWKSGKCITPSGSKFGTPSYPSPLDRIRTGRKDRAKQLGLGTPPNYADFESNQSFPGPASRRRNDSPEMDELKRCTLSTLKCDTLNAVSFAAGSAKGSFSESSPRHARSFGSSWVYYNFVGGGPTGLAFPTGIQNPNKAVLTINAKTTKILMANKMACTLLKVHTTQLYGKLLRQFLNMGKKWYASEETQLGSSGESVLISGKVMELVTSEADTIPVSVWLHKIPSDEEEQRQVIVLEPVNRAVATLIFDKQGTILCADEHLAALHGYQCTGDVTGLSITDLMPHLKLPCAVSKGGKLPKDVKKQNTTGRTCDGVSFPVTVRIDMIKDAAHEDLEEGGDASKQLYCAVLWVFANISGLVTVFPDGSIHSCNNNFALMLFGYNQSQLAGKNVTTLIPSFYDDIEFLDTESILLPPLGDDEEEEDEESRIYPNSSRYRNDSSQSYNTPRPMNPISKQIELMIEDVHSLTLDSPSQFLRNSSASEPPTRSPSADCFPGSIPTMLPSGSCHAQLNTNTSGEKAMASCFRLGAALTLPPRCAWPAATECHDAIVSPNRTSEKEIERERLRLPIRSEVGDFCFVKPTECTEKTGMELDSTPKRCSPVVERLREGITSTPIEPPVFERPPKFVMNRYGSLESLQSIPEGSYFGLGMHKNGSDLEIIYQIKKVELDDGHILYCLWISRDPEAMGEGGRPYCSLTFQSSIGNTSKLGFPSVHSMEQHYSNIQDESSVCDESYEAGTYLTHYTTLQQIGKGGFGYVKMAYRNSDKLLVVTKFMCKLGIDDENWVYDSAFDKKVPLEVSLLLTLKHPNIVQVLDVFENKSAYQLVMEKHGSGMDLFEFIDRHPELDEPLGSYIFRQVLSAVSYLHKLNIIHRDIKDENIILDQRFCIKLIDFGSATFSGPDRLYTTFCGTMEYCSPEVLQGNKYRGPELEMWSLGITLYVLMYGEDPFFTLEERLAARLRPPFTVSQSLQHLLSWILNPDPVTRCTLDEAVEHAWTNQPVVPEKYCFEDIVHATSEEINPSMYYNPDMPAQPTENLTSPVKSDRSEGKDRSSPSLSNASDECYEEQDSFS